MTKVKSRKQVETPFRRNFPLIVAKSRETSNKPCKEDNLKLDSHLATFPLSIRRLMNTFPLGARKMKEKKAAELQCLCFMMPARIIYVSSENRNMKRCHTGENRWRMFSRASACCFGSCELGKNLSMIYGFVFFQLVEVF
jgi:hypothetical protein